MNMNLMELRILKKLHGQMDKWMKIAICMMTQQIFVSQNKYKKIACEHKYFLTQKLIFKV